jgi:hypothetical protein
MYLNIDMTLGFIANNINEYLSMDLDRLAILLGLDEVVLNQCDEFLSSQGVVYDEINIADLNKFIDDIEGGTKVKSIKDPRLKAKWHKVKCFDCGEKKGKFKILCVKYADGVFMEIRDRDHRACSNLLLR